ncbi:mitochondrial import inner membrane translocase subunit Tim8 [Penicillium hispanicum]|uniref:mitochondrial import inner membrane translocase subunit Tim8 n=1 Tax=Penicillium hispanicum TaxID=1080232 RepID=UPI002542165F|nr:mitochondrial import inner membrane translocase subunit Tim8 [Penicillium hispanicum]KAJ5584079.1 mitochondrial import inner membrane translocase subunit Tim8 [Penicillium hispanicum]
MDPQAQLDLSKLNDSDKKELQQVIANESQKSNIQQMVHQLNDVCWKKCITGKISSGTLDKTEEACAQNCIERWMDTQLSILKQLESMRGH